MRRPVKENGSALALLTDRERECLLWSARGLSSKQIAERLGISIGAVDVHCGKAARKLAATKRIQAVAHAIALGLIKLEDIQGGGTCR